MDSPTNNYLKQHQFLKAGGRSSPIDDDAPTFRSAAIASRGPSQLAPKPPPALGPLRKLVSKGTTRVTPSDGLTRTPPSNKATSWNISDETLPNVSSLSPFEKNHVIINEPATVIAGRVGSCLGVLSISASKHCRDGVVKAETLEGIRFCIRFSCHDEGVLVEIQKRRGISSFGFQNVAKTVLAAAKGSNEKPLPLVNGPGPQSPSLRMPVPASVARDFEQDGPRRPRRRPLPKGSPEPSADNADKETILRSTLERIVKQLRSRRSDSNLLAMKGLESLTTVESCGLEVAIVTAKAVLGIETNSCLSELHGGVTSLLQRWSLHEDQQFEDPEEEDSEDINATNTASMRSHALCVLMNSLIVMSSQLSELVSCESSWLKTEMVPFLLEELSSVECRPRDALRATKCLASVIDSAQEFKAMALQLDVTSVVVDKLLISQSIGSTTLEAELTRVKTMLEVA